MSKYKILDFASNNKNEENEINSKISVNIIPCQIKIKVHNLCAFFTTIPDIYGKYIFFITNNKNKIQKSLASKMPDSIFISYNNVFTSNDNSLYTYLKSIFSNSKNNNYVYIIIDNFDVFSNLLEKEGSDYIEEFKNFKIVLFIIYQWSSSYNSINMIKELLNINLKYIKLKLIENNPVKFSVVHMNENNSYKIIISNIWINILINDNTYIDIIYIEDDNIKNILAKFLNNKKNINLIYNNDNIDIHKHNIIIKNNISNLNKLFKKYNNISIHMFDILNLNIDNIKYIYTNLYDRKYSLVPINIYFYISIDNKESVDSYSKLASKIVEYDYNFNKICSLSHNISYDNNYYVEI